jgi:hypothetical protein
MSAVNRQLRAAVQPRRLGLLLVALALAGCGRSPGPLEGTWRMEDPIPMTVIYRAGEEEAMGMISKVSFKESGSDVLVTYESGMAEGTTVRFTMADPNTAVSELGTLKRLK